MWGVILGILLLLMTLWLRWRKKQLNIFKECGIPGPEPNVLFGNLMEIMKKTPLRCHTEWIEKYGKVLGYYYGTTPMLLVADIELVKTILVKDFHNFPNRPKIISNLPNSRKTETLSYRLTNLQGTRWKDVRSVISPSFTTSKMKTILPITNDAVDTLLEILDETARDGIALDIHKVFQSLIMDIICRSAFGIQTDCQKNPDDHNFKSFESIFNRNISSILSIITLSFPELASFWNRVNTVRLLIQNNGQNPINDIVNMIKDVIQNRRLNGSNGRQDLLQLMIDARISESDLNKITNDELTAHDDETDDPDKKEEDLQDSTKRLKYMIDKEIVDNSVLFFLAGYSTTSANLAFTTHFLLHYPEVQQKIREEIKVVVNEKGKLDYNAIQQLHYLDQVIQESLRLYPPIHAFVSRVAADDVEYGSIKIPKGMAIQIPTYYLHHDSNLWKEPEKFDPNRFSSENKRKNHSIAFLPFGAGPRNCVGMRFAKLQVKIILARMLERYQIIPTEETDKDPPAINVSMLLLKPAKGINLRIQPL